MGDGSRHSNDVFVSYAHADDGIPLGAELQYGWVTALAYNLNIGPNAYQKKLFIDHQLQPGDVLSDDLLRKVEDSTVLLLLLSQNYIASTWCGKELDHFIRTHANNPENPTDVFVVELFPFKEFTGVPDNIKNTRKRLIHAKFWHQPPNAASPLLAGYPSPQDSEPGSRQRYWHVLQQLRNAIDSRLRALRRDQPSFSVAEPTLGTILLADTTDDLVAHRDAVKASLEPEGVVVLPEGDYFGRMPEEFRTEFTRDLARSELFVQLLSTTVDRTGKGFTAPLPQLQFDGAIAAKLPIMQWCERLPGPGEIADEGHRRLFNTEYLRVINRTSFEREILERLRAIKQARERDHKSAQAEPASVAAKKLIFIDDVAGEKVLNEKLRAWLRSANCDVRGLPPMAPLGNNGIDIAQVLKPCRAGITVFADGAKRVTVYNRLIFFLNQIAESHLPLVRWGIYVTPGTEAADLGLTSDGVITIDERRLADFVRGL